MKNELSQKIQEINNLITLENKSLEQVPEFIKETFVSKKKFVIEALVKAKTKLETDLAKIIAAEEKEQREAPVKALLAKINETNQIQKELKNQLERAKALSKQNPKDQLAIVEALKISNQIGDVAKYNAQLKEELDERKVNGKV